MMFGKLEHKLEQVLARAETLVERLGAFLPEPPPAQNWQSIAWRWRRNRGSGSGFLQPVAHPHVIRFEDLKDIDEQKARLDANTRQFVEGRPGNNVLLTGARGTGKSSLVKAALHRYARRGLRLIEVDRADLVDLPEIADLIAARPERFIIFSDDLSFEANDPGYKALKSVLDGGIAATNDNMLIYATSNRRHLMPEKMSENLDATHTEDGEIHPGETTEEKISLSERFGLWLSFYPFGQEEYLQIARHWVGVLAPAATHDEDALRKAALLWALERGSRSGRVAYQFARDWAGHAALGRPSPKPTVKRKAKVKTAGAANIKRSLKK
ncbi:MAG TPA: ATP-binding protein [Usitatibacteraceae bacterium]